MRQQPNQERIREWCAALRSGHYRQASGALRRGDSYCALGVACDVYLAVCGEEWAALPQGPGHIASHMIDGCDLLLPEAVYEYYGLCHDDPVVRVDGEEHNLTVTLLNDKRKLTLPQIADVIEDNYCDQAHLDLPQAQAV